MSAWVCMILAIGCITSHGSTPEDGSCEKVQPTIPYTFVGQPQFRSIYRNHSGAVQTTPEQHKKTITKTATEDCQLYAGASYRGTVAVTKRGRTCQRWGSQTPHEHYNSLAFLPLAGLEQNYCRNPDGEPGVWCYTTDPGKRWEYCGVPACVTKELETIERSGTYYRLVTKAMTYDDANETCAAHGGYLADVKTRELQDFLITKIQEVGADGCYWIGLNKITGNWTWSDGTPLSSCGFSDWAPGEPKGDQFVQLAITSHWLYLAGKWDDTGRHNHHYSICQTGPGEGSVCGHRNGGNIPEECPDDYCKSPERNERTIWCYTTDPISNTRRDCSIEPLHCILIFFCTFWQILHYMITFFTS